MDRGRNIYNEIWKETQSNENVWLDRESNPEPCVTCQSYQGQYPVFQAELPYSSTFKVLFLQEYTINISSNLSRHINYCNVPEQMKNVEI